ncbi:MAG TPA: GntR family transcriptional regulator [Candidatus Cybelea sp.]
MNGSFLVVDDASESPPYRQIVEQIRAAIERGELQPEMPLSPVRQLAGDLGVAPNTVARAYAELQTEGWLIGDGRRGTRVASQIPRQDRHARGRSLRESVERFVASLQSRGFSKDEIEAEVTRAL